MKNLCAISHTGDLGGAERSLLQLIKSIKTTKNFNLLVVVPSKGPLSKELSRLDINYVICKYEWWVIKRGNKRKLHWDNFQIHISNAKKIKKLINKFEPDLILTNTSVVCEGAIIAYMLNIPHVWHIRELGEKDHGFVFEFGFKNTAQFINDFSSQIIFNSKATKSEFDKFILNDKSAVIYNSIEIEAKLEDATIAVKFNQNNYLKILVAGTISNKKGQLEAVMAVSSLLKEHINNIEMIIIGKCTNQHLLNKIKNITRRYPSNFKIENFVLNPYPLFKSCDVVLVCSKNEAFGRTILEGMAFGKVVIATNSGGVPEIITNNKNGMLYSSGKQKELSKIIKSLIENPKLRDYLSQNGEKTLRKKFTAAKYTLKIHEILNSRLDYPKPRMKLLTQSGLHVYDNRKVIKTVNSSK